LGELFLSATRCVIFTGLHPHHRLMRLSYNILQLLLSPLIILYLLYLSIARKEKYQHLLPRFGKGLEPFRRGKKEGPVIWVHALSVGETTSAIALLNEIRSNEPDNILLFSTTTTSALALATEKVTPHVDAIIPFPVDIFFVVKRFLDTFNPDLFILVETDFWPNLLHSLSARNIPALLVNGRISDTSMTRYQRFRLFFKPMFNQFKMLCMQTAADARKMEGLGIPAHKIETLGNLKYKSSLEINVSPTLPFILPTSDLFIVCGSTHPGEEEIILAAYRQLLEKYPHLKLAIAPRKPSRTEEIERIAERSVISSNRYSTNPSCLEALLLIDTIGDLADLYAVSDISFIGGSLVPEGGHNPLESCLHGVPTLFGSYMDDFREISQELLASRAGFQVSNKSELISTLELLITSAEIREEVGENARTFMTKHKNVLPAHLAMIRNYL